MRRICILATLTAVACSSDSPDSTVELSETAQLVYDSSLSGNATRGGRLYDRFYSENPNTGFVPDSPDTPGVADGQGGPMNNGTLLDRDGAPIDNDLDHAFRLKNFYGWDLRGMEGVYGPTYQDKSYVVPHNLLDPALSREAITDLLVDGAPGVPAFGGAVPVEDLADVVEFVMQVREHSLPQPADIWTLNAQAPKGYVLRPGADPTRGAQLIASSCAASECHGSDGTARLFDDGEFSLGTLARASAYEVWFKIVAGNPGSTMMSQVATNEPWEVQSQAVLDVLAALCDTAAFPAGAATEPDVLPGDERCGSYLR